MSSGSTGNRAVVHEESEIRVYIDPPEEHADGDTDKDSDDSDEPDGLIHHFPRRLLESGAQARKRKRSGIGGRNRRLEADEVDLVPSEPRRPPLIRSWERDNPNLVGSKVPEYVKPVIDADAQSKLENTNTAYEFYRLFQPDRFINEIIYQSKLYGVQKGYTKSVEKISVSTYRCTEAMLLHSGYNGVPRRKMLWELKKDCHNSLVSENIRRAEVDAVLACLHFRDNSNLNDDPYFKVRPIFTNLNQCGQWIKKCASTGSYSVDETMVPYYGRHASKQFIRNKPIRFGYKVISFR